MSSHDTALRDAASGTIVVALARRPVEHLRQPLRRQRAAGAVAIVGAATLALGILPSPLLSLSLRASHLLAVP